MKEFFWFILALSTPVLAFADASVINNTGAWVTGDLNSVTVATAPQPHNIALFFIVIACAVLGSYWYFRHAAAKGQATTFYNWWLVEETNVSFATASTIISGLIAAAALGGFSDLNDEMLWFAIASMNIMNLAPFGFLAAKVIGWAYLMDSQINGSGNSGNSTSSDLQSKLDDANAKLEDAKSTMTILATQANAAQQSAPLTPASDTAATAGVTDSTAATVNQPTQG